MELIVICFRRFNESLAFGKVVPLVFSKVIHVLNLNSIHEKLGYRHDRIETKSKIKLITFYSTKRNK